MLQLPLSLSAQRSWILKFTINPSVEKCFPLSCGVRISAISALLAPTEIIFGHLLEQSTSDPSLGNLPTPMYVHMSQILCSPDSRLVLDLSSFAS